MSRPFGASELNELNKWITVPMERNLTPRDRLAHARDLQEVTFIPTKKPFSSVVERRAYDAVVMGSTPIESTI